MEEIADIRRKITKKGKKNDQNDFSKHELSIENGDLLFD